MILMALKKQPQKQADRHKPGKMARIRQLFAIPAEEAAQDIGTDFTEWVNQAVREKLEREGRFGVNRQSSQ